MAQSWATLVLDVDSSNDPNIKGMVELEAILTNLVRLNLTVRELHPQQIRVQLKNFKLTNNMDCPGVHSAMLFAVTTNASPTWTRSSSVDQSLSAYIIDERSGISAILTTNNIILVHLDLVKNRGDEGPGSTAVHLHA